MGYIPAPRLPVVIKNRMVTGLHVEQRENPPDRAFLRRDTFAIASGGPYPGRRERFSYSGPGFAGTKEIPPGSPATSTPSCRTRASTFAGTQIKRGRSWWRLFGAPSTGNFPNIYLRGLDTLRWARFRERTKHRRLRHFDTVPLIDCGFPVGESRQAAGSFVKSAAPRSRTAVQF